MADNVPITPGSGATIATDQDSGTGEHFQIVKLAYGARDANTHTLVDDSTPAPLPTKLKVYTGAGWEDLRTPGGADGGTVGVLAAGQVGWDGAAYRRLGAVAGDSGQNAAVVAGSRKEVAFSTTTAQAVGATDVSNYRHVSVHITGQGTTSTITFQGSNNNVDWTQIGLFRADQALNAASNSTTLGSVIFHGPMPFRFFRLNVTGITAGTTAGVIEFFSGPAHPNAVGIGTGATAVIGTADGQASQGAIPVSTQGYVFTGGGWDRLRTPTIFKTVTATATGNTAVWTPTAGKKFRLMGYLIILTSNAAKSAAGLLEITFQDSATALGLGFSSFVPASAGTIFTADNDSSWVLLRNGPLSAAANNVLNINLSAALTAGEVRVTVMGTEE